MSHEDFATIDAEQKPLRFLLIEDNPDDAELCRRMLRKHFPASICHVVTKRFEFVEHLAKHPYDIILADYALGNWTGMDALGILSGTGKDIPFILVTGALGDQTAVECIKGGMADYVLKNTLDRLPAAISRALENKTGHDQLRQAWQSLQDSETRFRNLIEANPAATFVEQGTRCCYVNSAAEEITGYTREELLKINFWSLVLPDSRNLLIERATERDEDYEYRRSSIVKILTQTKEVRRLQITVGAAQYNGKLAAVIIGLDITNAESENDSKHEIVDRLD